MHLNTLKIHEKKPSCDYVKPIKVRRRKRDGKKRDGKKTRIKFPKLRFPARRAKKHGNNDEAIDVDEFEDEPLSRSRRSDPRLRKGVKGRSLGELSGKVCRCGSTKILAVPPQGNGVGKKRSKVYVGGKRKVRCNKCTGCLAANCNICKHCRLPHWKKPCVERTCLFPILPECPCFA